MEIMTADQRNDLIWAKNAKMVRLGVYDVILVGMVLNRYADGKSIDRQEKGLTRDELEREQGVRFTKEELKDLGLD